MVISAQTEVSGSPVTNLDLPTSEELLQLTESSLDDDQAQEPVVITLKGKSSIADYMVIASGRSSRHVGSMAEHLREKLKQAGQSVSVEGLERGDWVLIDAGDIVVHLFRPEVREFYNLEKMWGSELLEAAATH
jgi:ribosome-associated protein